VLGVFCPEIFEQILCVTSTDCLARGQALQASFSDVAGKELANTFVLDVGGEQSVVGGFFAIETTEPKMRSSVWLLFLSSFLNHFQSSFLFSQLGRLLAIKSKAAGMPSIGLVACFFCVPPVP
jgi:hypothetical protein